jgi:hypothetical protein
MGWQPTVEAGEALPWRGEAAAPVDFGRWRHGEAGKPVGDHHGGVGA